jgi:hypothetical protein
MAEKSSKAAEAAKTTGKEIKLKHPIEFDNKTTTLIYVRRGKAKDILASELDMQDHGLTAPGDATRTMYMVAQLVELPIEAVEKMDLEDYLPLAADVADFL